MPRIKSGTVALFAALAGGLLAGIPGPLAAQGQRIELLGTSFDPLVEGEPALPPALRARSDGSYALLQLAAPPTLATLQALREAGVVFHDAIAGNAYLVRLETGQAGSPAAKRAEVAALAPVRWIGPLHGAYKISPNLKGGTLVVDLFPDADPGTVESAVRAVGVEVIERSASERVKLLVVEADAEDAPALAAIDGVRWVQDRPVFRLVNDAARYVVQANEAGQLPLYERGLSGAGQVGAVSDSGLDAFDFENTSGAPVAVDPLDAGCYFIDDGNDGLGGAQIAPSSTHRKVVRYVVPPGAGGDFTDESGHGTHVVGSIVGDQAPWGEVSPGDGQAYQARIHFQDLNVGGGLTVSAPSDLYNDLFAPAYDGNSNGIYDTAFEPRTHSNSWGSPDSTYDAFPEMVDLFMWDHPDFLILYSAGNEGPGPFTVGNPGTAKDIVTVGATENGDANPNNMTEYSSHGPIPGSGPPGSNRLSPTVGAPGNVVSALYKNACGTQALSGTSMATPTTQGVALLMREYLWEGYYPHGESTGGDEMRTPAPSGALLKALLVNSGERMTGTFTDNGAGGSWPSNGQGWGRITADEALYFQGDHRDLWLHDEYDLAGTVGLASVGETRSFTIRVGNGAPFETESLELTLVWTDYPGSMLDGGRLVNDLNLVVTDPLGGIHRGNDPAQNDFNTALDLPPAPDAVNPWEVVYLADPEPGTYTVTVNAAALGSLGPDPGRKQGFALVATGDLRSSRGRAEIERRSYNPIPATTARLRVTDIDRNQDPGHAESVTATVSSTTDPIGKMVTLDEIDQDAGTFVGDIELVILDQGQLAGPGQLSVRKGDTVRLSYADADDGTRGVFEAYDTATIEDPSVNLLNPPQLADPGETDVDGNYTLSWSPAELSNNRGLTRTLAFYVVEEATDYVLGLFDDAEGALEDHWTTHAPGGTSTPPWTKNPSYNHTPNPPPPGESYWSAGNEGFVAQNNNMSLTDSLTIPATVASARLTFYSRYFNEPDDSGNLEISTTGMGNWQPLLVVADAPSVPPGDTRLQHHEADLTPYLGQAFRVRFRMDGGDSDYFLYVTSGWWVDDITISGATWQALAVVPADATEYEVTGRFDGSYSYRVQAVYTDGSASAFSNVEGIEVVGAGSPAGRVAGLTLGKSGGDVTLSWGASCQVTDTDYAVYEGTLGDFTSHAQRLCSTSGATSTTLTPPAGSTYFLVVPHNGAREGSYGRTGAGAERPAADSACRPQQIGACE